MLVHRLPTPALAPFVERLWASEPEGEPAVERERALPTGCADLVVRLSDEPIRVFRGVEDHTGECFAGAVLCGMRPRYHVRDTSRPTRSIGVHFRPGGAAALLGIPAEELAGRHTALADLWGRSAHILRERILAAPTLEARMALLERALLERRACPLAPHPCVPLALERLLRHPGTAIESLQRESGLSHRRFVELFRRSVGLSPKVFARIQRFQRALRIAARAGRPGWSALALASGYCDQSHLVREFQELAGIPPGAYRPHSAARPNHVPVVVAPSA